MPIQLEGRRCQAAAEEDDAGVEATLRLSSQLGARAVPVTLPEGSKDVAELAMREDGLGLFSAALLELAGISERPVGAARCQARRRLVPDRYQ